jgi:hypothetical protein
MKRFTLEGHGWCPQDILIRPAFPCDALLSLSDT